MKHYIRLIRPVNFFITGISIYVSCLLAGGGREQFIHMFFASLAGACIAAGGMIINDIFDIKIDKINKPDRPLPSGAIGMFDAFMLYAGLSGAGIIMTFYTTISSLVIALLAAIALFFYSYKLKSVPLVGNLLIGALTGLAFIFGGAAVGNVDKALFPAIFALLINVGREIIKDMEDVEGDQRNMVVTFPIKYGMKKSSLVATLFLIGVVISTIIPYLKDIYGIKFLVLVMVGVNTVVLYVVYSLWKDTSSKNLNRLSNLLKWDMLIGLVAIYLG
jgi:geranylgeranylglycerol-phosphate geranylgeranyltransferase